MLDLNTRDCSFSISYRRSKVVSFNHDYYIILFFRSYYCNHDEERNFFFHPIHALSMNLTTLFLCLNQIGLNFGVVTEYFPEFANLFVC